MSRQFDPITGLLLPQCGGTGSTPGTGEDHHAAWNEIITGQTVTVSERKDMRVYQTIKNNGILINRGRVIID